MRERQAVLNSSQYTWGRWEAYEDEINDISSGNMCKLEHSAELSVELLDAVDIAVDEIGRGGIKVEVKYSCRFYILLVKEGTNLAAVRIEGEKSERSINFEILGERTLSENILKLLRGSFKEVKNGSLKWYRLEKGSLESNTIIVKSKRDVYSEFYPWIKDGVESYIDRFISSDASILLMLGPPGTGKTSLIRHMIASRNLNAMFSYDEALLESDAFFSAFIVGKSNLMVMEDADNLIGSRENGNKLIPRFLNTAEGLVKIEGKKMIFTTNLESVRNIDAALVRPGRCFDVMKTRLLTHKEMLAVVDVCGLESTPPWKEEYSLSEIFSPATHTSKAERRVGFY